MLEYIKIINCVKFYFINLDLIVIIGVDKKVWICGVKFDIVDGFCVFWYDGN